MAEPDRRHSMPIFNAHAETVADPDEFGSFIAPIVAGARARGVADAFELLDIAAVLIDGSGRVLHAGGRAERTMLPFVKVVGGHLVGRDAETNDLLQTVIADAISDGGGSRPGKDVTLAAAEGEARLTLSPRRCPHDGAPRSQLLRGIIIVTEQPQDR